METGEETLETRDLDGAAEPGMGLADSNAEICLGFAHATCLARKTSGAWILTGWTWRYMTCGFTE